MACRRRNIEVHSKVEPNDGEPHSSGKETQHTLTYIAEIVAKELSEEHLEIFALYISRRNVKLCPSFPNIFSLLLSENLMRVRDCWMHRWLPRGQHHGLCM